MQTLRIIGARERGRGLFAPACLTIALTLGCGARSELDDGGLLGGPSSSVASSSSGNGGGASTASAGGMSTTSSSGAGGGLVVPPNQVISKTLNGYAEIETSLAVGDAGVVLVDWVTLTGNGTQTTPYPLTTIGYAVSFDDGATFGPPEQLISPDGQLANSPSAVVDADGNFYVAWLGSSFHNVDDVILTETHVYVAKGTTANGAITFATPIEASDATVTGEVYAEPMMALSPSGALVVSYADDIAGQGGENVLHMARSVDGGQTFSHGGLPPDPAVIDPSLPYLCAQSNPPRLYAAYLPFPPTTEGTLVGLSWNDDDGATWLPTDVSFVNAPGDKVGFDRPTCAAAGADVWVTYGIAKAGTFPLDASSNKAILLAHSADGGQTIAERISIADPSAGKFTQHAAMAREEDTGSLDFSYYAGESPKVDNHGVFARSRAVPPTGPVAPAEVVEQPVEFIVATGGPQRLGDYSGLATKNGELYMSFVATDFTDPLAYFSHIAFTKRALP